MSTTSRDADNMNESDTPASQESGDLSLDAAADTLGSLMDPPEEEAPAVDTEIEPKKPQPEAESDEEDVEPPEGVEEGDDAPITLEVDGKQVTLTKAQVAEAYKNGLRQADYTQKTMAVAEQRKAAEAETQKARQERTTYVQNLNEVAAQLKGALQQHAQIDWDDLIAKDPVEALRQQHLQTKRQAAYQETQQRLQEVDHQDRAERLEATKSHLASQQQELLAKLPQWKDAAKATAERDAIKANLVERGYTQEEVANITDHKAVLLARDAMLYRQMLDKAQAAAKKVQTLPEKVMRPGVSAERSGRPAALRGSKALSPESAGEIFTSMGL